MPHPPFVFDPVVEGVLHQRLQGQLQDLVLVKLLRDPDLIFQDIPVAELLDLEITADV